MEPLSALEALSSLKEPLRREVYRYVAGQREPAGRDQVAAALGVARSVAAFHLDRLAEAGLLDVEFRRPPGRRGPGAGRPAKLYRRRAGELSYSVPERHYELAGRLLAHALVAAQTEGTAPLQAARAVARAHGLKAGLLRPAREGTEDPVPDLLSALGDQGYEPVVEGRSVVLANCPFHVLAEEQRDLICGMNLALVEGLVEALGGRGLQPCLRPSPDRCCVVVDT